MKSIHVHMGWCRCGWSLGAYLSCSGCCIKRERGLGRAICSEREIGTYRRDRRQRITPSAAEKDACGAFYGLEIHASVCDLRSGIASRARYAQAPRG